MKELSPHTHYYYLIKNSDILNYDEELKLLKNKHIEDWEYDLAIQNKETDVERHQRWNEHLNYYNDFTEESF
jgi:hypothetical protein